MIPIFDYIRATEAALPAARKLLDELGSYPCVFICSAIGYHLEWPFEGCNERLTDFWERIARTLKAEIVLPANPPGCAGPDPNTLKYTIGLRHALIVLLAERAIGTDAFLEGQESWQRIADYDLRLQEELKK